MESSKVTEFTSLLSSNTKGLLKMGKDQGRECLNSKMGMSIKVTFIKIFQKGVEFICSRTKYCIKASGKKVKLMEQASIVIKASNFHLVGKKEKYQESSE